MNVFSWIRFKIIRTRGFKFIFLLLPFVDERVIAAEDKPRITRIGPKKGQQALNQIFTASFAWKAGARSGGALVMFSMLESIQANVYFCLWTALDLLAKMSIDCLGAQLSSMDFAIDHNPMVEKKTNSVCKKMDKTDAFVWSNGTMERRKTMLRLAPLHSATHTRTHSFESRKKKNRLQIKQSAVNEATFESIESTAVCCFFGQWVGGHNRDDLETTSEKAFERLGETY